MLDAHIEQALPSDDKGPTAVHNEAWGEWVLPWKGPRATQSDRIKEIPSQINAPAEVHSCQFTFDTITTIAKTP